MQDNAKIKVGISIGDLNGIGCEVILKTFEDPRTLELCTPVVFASSKTLAQHQQQLGTQLVYQGVASASEAIEGKFNAVNIWKELPEIHFGKETKIGGEYALKSLEAATKALKEGAIDVLVTAPINKSNIQSEAFSFPGHTDYLAKELGGESLMFMVSDSLRIGLLTDHVAVSEVSNHITPELIKSKVKTILHALQQDFGIRKPKVALLGINPHNGDQGVIGKEDQNVLIPTIAEISNEGSLIFGPYAADSFFGTKNYTQFDAILAAYHDQGLIPFKTLSFGNGVNFTAGLSKVRTSPDHGTAYDIAGKGLADHSSFSAAVFAAIKIFKHRSMYKTLTDNPLKKAKIVEKRSPKKSQYKPPTQK
ncbi:4-hydroxythreonine-4-phosphate dehydrogenase PdxA [Flavobacteriaceae bacterium]|nr:4-hydroxythreonine-4-phosphate dehydrogenase PdxA [Flavobacteriaceae bacterium]MDB9795409.1 4-hydroxythreonine-4-phosphate dehydrogenase PdxA [Flavobacteriaceae bacterium]MDB9831083.1 4-hydroxythreonine-4-phosphate dehydrogenase PdxA [Flavobacteriaceae bacterium]MDC0119670.1 4-hydroxythreonine-4-phosphate dehydrogenase PdxA [Flavobacteriaceae bacterium]MDC1495932.1 4-hydroxythreonine-4-phosphate dehydrogenase PdxA [Flavobacteriaceae bacterium]